MAWCLVNHRDNFASTFQVRVIYTLQTPKYEYKCAILVEVKNFDYKKKYDGSRATRQLIEV
jgi:hypothetical protein